jgi:type VI secretion system secreted protein VgrG
MPSPKSGSAGSIVAPADPTEADDADSADPGEVEEIKAEQKQKQAGKYGSTPVKPYKPPSEDEPEEEKTSWVEIALVDEDDQPVSGEKYEITLPDGRVAKGTTDQNGVARVEGIDPGSCQVTFPNLDKDAWEKA